MSGVVGTHPVTLQITNAFFIMLTIIKNVQARTVTMTVSKIPGVTHPGQPGLTALV